MTKLEKVTGNDGEQYPDVNLVLMALAEWWMSEMVLHRLNQYDGSYNKHIKHTEQRPCLKPL